jgi:hypothetical protein
MDGSTESALHGMHRESVAHALHTWRLADATLRHPFLSDQRAAYERAVAAVSDELRRFRTVAELVAYEAAERRTLRAAVVAACAGASGEPRLLAVAIDGAAFWRRVRELVVGAV